MDPTLLREILVMPNDLLKKLEWGFDMKQNSPFSPVPVAHKWCQRADVRRWVLPPPRHGKRKVCNHATKHSFNRTDNLISRGFVEYIELKDGSNRRKGYLEYLTILREQRQMSEGRQIAKYTCKWL